MTVNVEIQQKTRSAKEAVIPALMKPILSVEIKETEDSLEGYKVPTLLTSYTDIRTRKLKLMVFELPVNAHHYH